MVQIDCHMICHSNSAHLSQLFTGFALLHRVGSIHLSQECKKQNYIDNSKPKHLRNAKHAHLRVIVNGKIILYYDTHDSYEIDEDAARESHFYYKRSYAPLKIPGHLRTKVFPLGLNYDVHADGFDRFEMQRVFRLSAAKDGAKWKHIHRFFAGSLGMRNFFRPTINNIQSAPDKNQIPRILFMVRAWDPQSDSEMPKEKIEERIYINETRARCIEMLKKEFGNAFMGGFAPTDYAMRQYKHIILLNNSLSLKRNYIDLLKSYPICVATTGLHGSIGWKMGEYVAFSKAIVSEKLNYEVPGDFKSEKNYLEFSASEQCVDTVNRIFSDPDFRFYLMENNYKYYLSYLKPDVIIMRTLKIALSAGL